MDSQNEEIEALRADIAALDRVRFRLNEKLIALCQIHQAANGGLTSNQATVIDIFSRLFPPRSPPQAGDVA